MRPRVFGLFVLILVAFAGLAGTASAKKVKTASKARYYLALGDSLSQGQQPNLQGISSNTNEGYPDDLYQTELRRIHSLQLVKLGCGGETSGSMITGKGNADAAYNHCHPAGGSQLAAAVRFLKGHHRSGEVPLVTLDIGANDVDPCATSTDVGACVSAGVSAISTNTPKILAAIKKAAPKGTTFVEMNLYDPVLAGYFAPAGSTANQLASASQGLLQSVNTSIQTADAAAGVKIADVADAFDSYAPFSDTVAWEGQQIPLALARVCAWTWACSTPPSGPNIHANKNGYQVIANTFASVIGRLR
jgi:lysophospholipase L1-like esterase